jgi:rod shape-determining protein MreC
MRNVLLFFQKHQFFSLFVILEVISFLMLSHSYSYQRMLRFNAASDVTGTFYTAYHNLTDYIHLKEENRQLLEENGRLYNMLLSQTLSPDSTHYNKSDSSYRYIPAMVVHSTVNHANNFIILNKGKRQGVQKEMGVVSGKGIAGIVVGVSAHYAIALSLLNRHTHISGRIKKDHQLVNVVWDNGHGQKGKVIDIPAHIQLQAGDTIITSGNSFVFPPGLNIGVVTDFEKSKNNTLNKAGLRFCTDFNSLHYVYVIKNLDKQEKIKLLKEASHE